MSNGRWITLPDGRRVPVDGPDLTRGDNSHTSRNGGWGGSIPSGTVNTSDGWAAFLQGRCWTRTYLDENRPNASCPVCGQRVWFFRNENGGCAYFDEVGWPWPKHPCMDSSHDQRAAWQARIQYHVAYFDMHFRDLSRAELEALDECELSMWIEALEKMIHDYTRRADDLASSYYPQRLWAKKHPHREYPRRFNAHHQAMEASLRAAKARARFFDQSPSA